MPCLSDHRGATSYGVLLGMLMTVGISAGMTTSANMYYGGEDGLSLANPLSGELRDRVNQNKTVADMTTIGKANTAYLLRTGRYAESIAELEKGMRGLSLTDPWGTAWVYHTDGKHFVLASLGSDAACGPKPPQDWGNDVYEPDLILRDGDLIQAPRGMRLGS